MSAPVKEDFLEEDPEIRSQKFVLLSFLSPENVLEKKDEFFFGEFVKQYEIDYKIRNLETFLVSVVRGINDKLTKEADKMDASGVDLSGAALSALTEAATLCRKSRLNIGGILPKECGQLRKKEEKEFYAKWLETLPTVSKKIVEEGVDENFWLPFLKEHGFADVLKEMFAYGEGTTELDFTGDLEEVNPNS